MKNRPFIREMDRKGVDVLDHNRIVLRCRECMQEWSPDIQPGGRMPRGYWKCPNGCNEPDKQALMPTEGHERVR
jgi:hypothetical protein